MKQWTMLAASLLGGLAIDKLAKRQESGAQAPSGLQLGPPMQFTPEQVRTFTHRQGNTDVLEFDRYVVERLLPEMLALRSAVPLVRGEAGELHRLGQVWQVVPMAQDLHNAWQVLSQARRRAGTVVLGSLSLVMLPAGTTATCLFVVASAGAAAAAREGSPFAVIPSQVELPAQAQGQAEAAPANEDKIKPPESEAKPKPHLVAVSNGAAAAEPTPSRAAASEEG